MPESQPSPAEQLALIDQEVGERKIIVYDLTAQRKQMKRTINAHEQRMVNLYAARVGVADKVQADKAKAPVPDVKPDPVAAAQAVGAKRGRPPKAERLPEEAKPVAETNGHPANA